MERFARLTSPIIPLSIDNVDTDQIIPARFLITSTRSGLGDVLFADWRFLSDGRPDPGFALNRPEAQGARFLLSGANFGCGSSREHAVWALTAWGLRAVIAFSFADLFRNNALKNGLLCLVVSEVMHRALFSMVAERPLSPVTIDLAEQTLSLPDGRSASFPIGAFHKDCLLKGLDPLNYLLAFEARIAAYEATHKKVEPLLRDADMA